MPPDASRYTRSESLPFTFIGRAEGSRAGELLAAVENCLIGLNLEPDRGWAWVPEGFAVEGNVVERLLERVGAVLHGTDLLDAAGKARLAAELATALQELLPGTELAPLSRIAAGEGGGGVGQDPSCKPGAAGPAAPRAARR